jgi:hypothetical protein
MNFNLPRSSDILGAKLSSRFVFLDIAIGAFAPSWQFSYDHSRQAISGDEEQLPATVDPPGDPELQVRTVVSALYRLCTDGISTVPSLELPVGERVIDSAGRRHMAAPP